LKLVSGAIRTIAISASAMVGNALVGFRRGTTDLLHGDVSYQNMGFIFGIPNARMSSCPCFQHSPPLACLDNSVSGIPNAIPAGLLGDRARCRGRRGMGDRIAQAMVLKTAHAADELKN
jgi:hypothetical protein